MAFTGSSTNGVNVMKSAAEHVARVTLELGGKSNVVFRTPTWLRAANGVIVLGCSPRPGRAANRQ
ncbi:aldehyde dehydrogenase family protein [Pseudonocardia sp. MCCB 268]|nr:aldehyde dehydrogenase family protein [Pseudonocardia cytotoxica]